MNNHPPTSQEEIQAAYINSINDIRAGLADGRYQKAALASLSLYEARLGVRSKDLSTAREHFSNAANAQKELFEAAWEHRDDESYRIPGANDRSDIGPVGAIHGMFAAMAAGDWEIARVIANMSGFKDDMRWASKDATLYAQALRQLLLKHDFSAFSLVPEKRRAIGYPDLATIFLTAENDREKALEKLKEFDQMRSKSKEKNDLIFQLSIPAIRNWLNQE